MTENRSLSKSYSVRRICNMPIQFWARMLTCRGPETPDSDSVVVGHDHDGFLSGLFRSASIVAAVGSSSSPLALHVNDFAPRAQLFFSIQHIPRLRVGLSVLDYSYAYSWTLSGNPGSLPTRNSTAAVRIQT